MSGYQARCYCGAARLEITGPSHTVAICHCGDCQRWTGAPMPAFAASSPTSVSVLPLKSVTTNPSVERWNCAACGSPIGATFAYLPDQIYIPLGIIDGDDLIPQIHCHAGQAAAWLHLDDGLPQAVGTGRDKLTDLD